MRQGVWFALATLVTLYAVACTVMWAAQEALLFPAPSGEGEDVERHARALPSEVSYLKTTDGEKLIAAHRRSKGTHLVLFFHGNGEGMMARNDLQELVLDAGWDFAAIAYRGYPGSTGKPSEEGLKLDAEAAWRWATEELGYAPSRIVIHGKSLGGGVSGLIAGDLAKAAGGLVLESTFLSVVDVAQKRFPTSLFPVALLIKNPFYTKQRAQSFPMPALVVHSTTDGLIPVKHGRELAKLIPNAQFVETPTGGHGATLVAWDQPAKAAYLGLLSRVSNASPAPNPVTETSPDAP